MLLQEVLILIRKSIGLSRVGRTARYHSGGRSVLFLLPSEMKMLEKLQEAKVPIQFIKANKKRLQPVSGFLSALLVKDENLQRLATRAFVTYLRSIHIQKEKEVFDLMKLPIDEYSASLGLPMTPKIRFLNQKTKGKTAGNSSGIELDNSDNDDAELAAGRFKKEKLGGQKERLDIGDSAEENTEKTFLLSKDTEPGDEANLSELMPATRVLKKKKLKINIHRPVGTRVVFDEDGNTLPPLARVAGGSSVDNSSLLDKGQREEYYKKARQELALADREDKLLDRQRRRAKLTKEKMKRKIPSMGEEENVVDDDDLSGSEEGRPNGRKNKRSKIYFNNDSDEDINGQTAGKGDNVVNTDSISLAEQEALALKLLSSMNSQST